MSAEFPDAPIQGYDLQALRGIVDPSFVIEGELVEVAPMDMPGERAFPFVAPIRLLIEFDAGGAIVLREDREYGDPGPRCPDPAFHCLVPLVLTRID